MSRSIANFWGYEMLSDFTVVYASNSFDGRGSLIHCFDGRELVLAVVQRTALDDYFAWTGRSARDANLVTDSNLASFEKIISTKYLVGDYGYYEKYGRVYRLLTVNEQDMHRSGLEFTDRILAVAEPSGWADPRTGEVQRS